MKTMNQFPKKMVPTQVNPTIISLTNRVPPTKVICPIKKKPRLRGEYIFGVHTVVAYPTKSS